MWRGNSLEKDPDAGRDWRQEEKGTTEDKMVGWHHWLNEHKFEQALGDGKGQEGLVCCSLTGFCSCKESDTTEQLNNTNLNTKLNLLTFYKKLQIIFVTFDCVHACSVASVVSDSVWPYGLQPARLLCPWDSPGKNTGVGCHAFLQGIFPTKASHPCLSCLPASAGRFCTMSTT